MKRGKQQPEMFFPTHSTLSLKTMLAVSSPSRNPHPDVDHVAVAIGVHPDTDQDLYAEPPEDHEGFDVKPVDIWKLHRSLYWIPQSTKTVAPTRSNPPAVQNPFLILAGVTDPESFRVELIN